ncbi:hypothetical protein E0Z10_g3026 [Xylaria hypoxylon]|uniref:Uncharacterized protein n=1 Tax=Xylaria hypoxylon TaxID=37992 RepID=A0A4Z0Z1V7_9PEZI|nr:hypothetical protein E0Z10_g3026 [Xylaria hypoxylon]
MTNTVASFKTDLSNEAIPESPSQDTPAKFPPKKELKTSRLEPNANPDKVMDQEEPQTKMLPGNPTATSAARLGGTVFNEGISDALNGTPSTTAKAKVLAATKPASKTAAPVSTAKLTTRASKSTLIAKPPNGKESTKAASSVNPKKATVTKMVAAKPAPISLAPSDTGFVKPKPKSPTRPVKLPSSLTTHTAASAQKHGSGNTAPAPRQSLSRASGNAQHLSANPTTHRSPSRNSVSTTGTTTATTTKTLKHKPSSVGRSRPSLGPPPKQENKNQPAAKREGHVDESFLARMMRPTQSSAKKTSEKTPVTPPRKQSTPVKKPDIQVQDVDKNARGFAAKIQASSTQAKATRHNVKPEAVQEQPTTKETSPVVAQVETTETDIKEAKPSTHTAVSPLVEDEKIETELTANDVAVTVAQEEKVEDIIETAKASTDTAVSADIPSEERPEIAEVEIIPEPAINAEADTSEPVTPVPVITEDPLKVEDMEDIVQEFQEPSHQPQSTDSAVEVSEPEYIPETKESITALIEESNVDDQGTVDEPSKPEELVADAEDTASEGARTDGSTTIDTPLDGTTDGIEEVTTKDTMATATAP